MAAVRHNWALAPFVLAVLVAASIGGMTWGGRTPSPRAHLVDEVAEYHEIFSGETQHLVEVPGDEIEELTAWLGGRVGRAIKVPDLASAGLHFAGGRMLVVSDHPVAALIYTEKTDCPSPSTSHEFRPPTGPSASSNADLSA